MDCMGVWASGTTFVTFDEVRVPVENLIGNENEGFKYIMHNFNHERWGFVVQANRFARVCYEEAFTYAHRGGSVWPTFNRSRSYSAQTRGNDTTNRSYAQPAREHHLSNEHLI